MDWVLLSAQDEMVQKCFVYSLRIKKENDDDFLLSKLRII